MRVFRCDKCGRKAAFVFWMAELNMEVCVNCYQKQLRKTKKGRRSTNGEKAEMRKVWE